MADSLGPHTRSYQGSGRAKAYGWRGTRRSETFRETRKPAVMGFVRESGHSGCRQTRESSDSRVDLSGQSAVRLRREGLVVIGKRVGDTARLERSNP